MTPNWKTRTIWTGDNLHIMRGMNSESVDLIYLDPPFNSNRTYEAPIGSQAAGTAFKDTWTLNDLDEAWHGELAEQEPPLHAIIDAAGIAHGKGMKSYLIMMGVRLLEMRRILKPTGSVYLHCDPTASHYLKMEMDAIFGQGNFRSEIAWKRTSAHSDTKQGRKQHGHIHDALLFYTKSGKTWTWNPVFTDYEPEYIKSFYRHIEKKTERRFRKDNLTAAKPGGDTLYEWRVKRPVGGEWEADISSEWETPLPGWEYTGVPPYRGRYWAYSQENMREYALKGRIVHSQSGMPNYKRYLDEMPGVPLQDIWIDINPVQSKSKERVGYPTQKPIALLDRIIRTSSNPGDMVLDPFCGCATACISAEKLERHWAGMDLSPKAADLVIERAEREIGGLFKLNHREDIPRRSDQGSMPHYRTQKHTLFGQQEGYCNGCKITFPFRNFTIDHVTPRSQGGTDHLENLQLLCGACNSTKGDRDQRYLMAALKRQNQHIAQTEAA